MSLSEIKQLVSVAFQAGRMDAQFEMGLRSDRTQKGCRMLSRIKRIRKADD